MSEPLKSLKVRATQPGYYGHDERFGAIFRYPGDVFTITPRTIVVTNPENNKPVIDPVTREPKTMVLSVEQQFSYNWMEPVDDATPERLTTAKEATAREAAERNSRGIDAALANL